MSSSKNIGKIAASQIKLAKYSDLFGTENDIDNQIIEVPIIELHTFTNHPFKVKKDDKMQELVASIKERGILVPGIVRHRKEGGYEIIAGHRRAIACEMAGLKEMKVIVMDLSDDEATIIMVDSNIQRENLLPSEKSFAFRMKFEALRHQGSKCGKSTAVQIGEEVKESGRQIQRYIRLTELITPLLNLVDERKLSFISAVDLSYLSINEQQWVYKKIVELNTRPLVCQTEKIKQYSNDGKLTEELVKMLLLGEKKEQKKLIIPSKKIKNYFPKNFTIDEMKSVIYNLLEEWKKVQEKGNAYDGTKDTF